MDISFIIITNGNKPQELLAQIQSIEALEIPKYEIIICGDIKNIDITKFTFVKYIENKKDAERGSLGGLRNRACETAAYSNLVISDDDMLFTNDWYVKTCQSEDYEIMTTCIRNPDGTRFWDNACYQSPTHGHTNLNYNEKDDYLYMSGGQSWLIKKSLWEKIKWNEDLLIYKMSNLQDYSKGLHNEDTDFSLRCREQNLKIKHNPNIVVFHNDKTYTGIGKMVRRRSFYPDHKWVESFKFPEKICLEFCSNLIKYGLHAEAADLLRYFFTTNGSFMSKNLLDSLEKSLGGPLENSDFYFEFHPDYNDLVHKFIL